MSPVLYDHFQRQRWEDVDIVLAAGDLPPDYLDFLATSLQVPVLYVRGNHDAAFEESRYEGFTNLHGRIVEQHGLRFAGFEGSHRYNRGQYQYSQGEMRRRVLKTRLRARLQGTPDIVLAHAPPLDCHDAADACHRGFAAFRTAIEAWDPAYFVHGHVHAYQQGPATSRIGNTEVLNAYPYRLFTVDPEAIRSASAPDDSAGSTVA